MIDQQIDARARRDRGQAFQEFMGSEDQVAGAVVPRAPERTDDTAVSESREPLLRKRWAQEVPAESFEANTVVGAHSAIGVEIEALEVRVAGADRPHPRGIGEEDSPIPSPLSEDPAMKKPKIAFRHFSGSGPLSVYWHDGPYGDAVEASSGRGVAWLTPKGELLGVEFDDVAWARDEQTLELPNGEVVALRVVRGKASVQRKHPRGKHRAA